MIELLTKDWKNILGIIYRVNSACSIERLQSETLESLRRIIQFHQGIFHIYQKTDGQFRLYNNPYVLGAEALYLDEFNRKYVNDDFFNVGTLISSDEVFRDTDIFPDEQRMQTDWYRDIYAKQGIHYAMRCLLTRDEVIIGSIDLFRQIEDVDFSDKDVRILEVLSRHISQKLNQLLHDISNTDKHSMPYNLLRVQLVSSFGLTARECDVVLKVIEGLQDVEVAEKLCITQSTLKRHIHNIYHKMGIRNRTQLYAVVQNSLRTISRK